MTKKSRKRPARFEKHQSGCMWSLINMFDFRHGSPSQKQLADRKHVDKRIVAAEYPDIKETLRDSCDVKKEPNAVVESETPTTVESSKMSVKELMEEEMADDQDQKKHASCANRYMKHEKSHERTRSKIDLELDDFVAVEEISDLNVMVEEICNHQKDVIHFNLGHDVELAIQPIEEPSCIEEKLCEATKVLVDHFTDRKGFNKDELVDALQIMNSNKDVFLKLLNDPNSLLAKNIQCLQDIQVLEQNSGNAKPQSFFWRRFKGLERNSSKKSEDLSRIVVLKPSSLVSRSSSAFSFTEIRRKLKHAMRKEKIQLENEIVVPPQRRVYNNIYVEAKRHLAQIVGSGDVDFDTRGKKQVPKALGRIISFSGYSSPTISSPRTDGRLRLSLEGKSTHSEEVDADIVRSSDADISSESSEELCLSTNLEQENCDHSGTSSNFSVSETIKDVDITSDATSKPSPVSVLDLVFKEDKISPPDVESFQPRQIHFEIDISSSPEQCSYNRNNIESNKYTFEFVRAVVQMSGLTWDKLLRRSLFSDHLIDPELINEVDFLPDLLPCDFNLLFYLIIEVLTEICRVNFGSTLSFAKTSIKPELRGKDILTEIWKGVDWYLKLDGGPRLTLNQMIGNNFGRPETWMDLQLHCEGIGIRVQEAIIEELVQELIQDIELVRAQMALQIS